MKPCRGYILLTVLLLLMLAAVMMAAFCRLAISKSLEASAAEDDLQRRWGTLSCRDTILPNAENILELNETTAAPVGHVHEDLVLGNEKFGIDICDEQAKANVNTLYAIDGKDRAQQSIQALVHAAGADLKARLQITTPADVQLKPAPTTGSKSLDDSPDPTDSAQVAPIVGSWSQVFPRVQASDLWPDLPAAVTQNLTCWGNGALNLRRASMQSLSQICSPVLSPQQIAQLLVLRGRLGDDATVDQLLAVMRVQTSATSAISARLTLVSATQSLWIRSSDHSGVQRTLFVRDGSNSDDVRVFSFQW
jgi:hypothetical protein